MIRSYLLGELPRVDSTRVEERLLVDDAFYEELLIVEDELIDEYLTGGLSESERKRFEENFLTSTDRNEKLRFAGNLKKYVCLAESSYLVEKRGPEVTSDQAGAVTPIPRSQTTAWLPWKSPVLAYSLASALVLGLVFVSIFTFRNLTRSPRTGPGRVLAVELTPGLTRGDEAFKLIVVPSGTDTVQLDLRIAGRDQYKAYRAVLQDREGREKFKRHDLTASFTETSGTVSFQTPANLLSPGDYYVKLSGANQSGDYQDLGRYSFRIADK